MSAPAGSSSSGGAGPSGGPGPGGGGGVPPGPPGFYGLGPQAPMPGLSPEQFALLLAQVGGSKEKDTAVEDRVISRFRFGATDKSPLMKSWHNRDDYLPFPEWSQAFHSLVQMWRHFRPPVPDEDPNEDPVQHFVKHFLIVVARITSQNWPIWREYDKRIRRIIWADAASEQSINFVPSKLNTSILADAEVTITGKMGSACDFTTIQDSAWWAIASASGSDIVKLGKKFADSVTRAISAIRSPPVSPSSKDKGKRKREDDHRPGPSEPFRGGDSRGGDGRSSNTDGKGASALPTTPSNAKVPVGSGPAPKSAYVANSMPVKKSSVPSVSTDTGHYCSQCGKRGHRAIQHGIASEAAVEAASGPIAGGGGPNASASGTTGGDTAPATTSA
ncbi:unnamed protein product [Tilletia laevis]|nr:unnamed protein product [Tilletia laevis]